MNSLNLLIDSSKMYNAESLADLLMIENSRRNTDLVADLVHSKPELFNELIKICLRNEEPVSRRAAWVADAVAEKEPELLKPHLESMTAALTGFGHDGLRRMTLRMLTRSPLPQKYLGELMRTCFDWLISPYEPVAVKVYSMDILYLMSQDEPELKKELADSIEWRLSEETPGFRAHGRKLLKKLNEEMNS